MGKALREKTLRRSQRYDHERYEDTEAPIVEQSGYGRWTAYTRSNDKSQKVLRKDWNLFYRTRMTGGASSPQGCVG